MSRLHDKFIFSLVFGLFFIPSAFVFSQNTDTPSYYETITEENINDILDIDLSGNEYLGFSKFSIPFNESPSGDLKERLKRLLIQTYSFKFHADFLTQLKESEFFGLSPKQIDQLAFYHSSRRVLLGSILYEKGGTDLWKNYQPPWNIQVQLLSRDPLKPSDVKAVFDYLNQANPKIFSKISYLPTTDQLSYALENQKSFTDLGIDIVKQKSSKKMVCYSNGWGVGRVKRVKAADFENLMKAGTITSEDILVMDAAPRDMPIVAGLVVGQTSSPSSHPALIAEMAKIPFYYEEKAFTSKKWKDIEKSGELVFLSSKGDGSEGFCQVVQKKGKDVSSDEAATLIKLHQPEPLVLNPYDKTAKKVLDLTSLGRQDGSKAGSKAANLAELMKVIPNHSVQEGLALPITFYYQFLNHALVASTDKILIDEISPLIQKIRNPLTPTSEVYSTTEKIRSLISKAELPDSAIALKNEILRNIENKWQKGTRIRLRSSSNVEDHPRFNGAGLYQSKGACVGDDSLGDSTNENLKSLCGKPKLDPIWKDLKKVWAGFYTFKGFMARRFFSVDESLVGMGVLIHPSFKGEKANGVMISQIDRSNSEELGFMATVTGFPGEKLSVTNPPAGKVPETSVLQNMFGSFSARKVVTSTEVPVGRRLMTLTQYEELYRLMNIIHKHYVIDLPEEQAKLVKLDFEWKLMPSKNGDTTLVVKQVRPVPNQNGATQQRGRGSILLAEREKLFCPTAAESDNAMLKLLLSHEMKLDIGLHEVPTHIENGYINNPIEALKINIGHKGEFVDIDLPKTVEMSADKWSLSNYDGNERRIVQLKLPLVIDSWPSMTLVWSLSQVRSPLEKEYLIDPVKPSFSAGFGIILNEDFGQIEFSNNTWSYNFVQDATTCESDAYQGEQPGRLPSPHSNRKPVSHDHHLETPDGKILVDYSARTSVGGVDKTTNKHIDHFTLKGLIKEPLVVKANLSAVYAPAHHNFSHTLGVDLYAAENISDKQLGELKALGIRYLLIGNSQGNRPQELFLTGVSELGVKKELGLINGRL